MVTCRNCKFLNTYIRRKDYFMGWSLGYCNKRHTFVWTDIIPCKDYQPKEK